MMEHGSQLVNQAILRLLNIRFGPYICSDVVEFGDESMFNDVNGNLRQDDHQDIGEQHPQVVWGENGTRNFVICRESHAWNIFFGRVLMLIKSSLDTVFILPNTPDSRYNQSTVGSRYRGSTRLSAADTTS